jgi:hypothetical protein
VKRLLILTGVILVALVVGHTALYGPPCSAPNGVSVSLAGHCAGYTWSNGIGQTGLWEGCNQ